MLTGKVCSAVFLTTSNTYPSQIFSRCGHLDFTSFQLIVTKLRRDEIIVWCHVCALNVSIHYCSRNREHYQDCDSVVKVYWWIRETVQTN